MDLPKGNPLMEKVALPFTDINIMLGNLEQQGFTGYVKLDLGNKVNGVIFYSHGSIVRVVEVDDTNTKVYPLSRILNKARKKELNTSTYVMSSRLIGVLSCISAFQPLYLDYEVKERELKKVMGTLEADLYTGIVEFITRDGTSFVLLEKGELVTDFFAAEYGQIISGTDSVSKFLDFVCRDGAIINIFAEKQEEIDARKKIIEEEMEKIKQLILKEEKGFFKAGDVFWIDEYILQEWGVKSAKGVNIEMETSEGAIHIIKAQAGKKLGGYITTHPGNFKKMKLKEGDLVSVRPVK